MHLTKQSRAVCSAVVGALLSAALALTPVAAAAPAPPPPGPPPGYDGLPYHNMPGRIGHQPGAYTWVLGFYLRPRRVLDSAGIGAMSNSDVQASEFGLPGSQLGVEPTRRAWTGNAAGVRAGVPMDATTTDPAAGVKPSAGIGGLLGGGPESPSTSRSDDPSLAGESPEPKAGNNIEPDTQNAGPDPSGPR